PQRVLVGGAEQPVRLGSKVLVGLGSRPLEYVDRLLGLALRQAGLCEQDAGLLGSVSPREVLRNLGQHAGGERVVLRIEGEVPLRDLAAGTALRGLRREEVPCEEPQSDDERHRQIRRRLFVAPDPVSEPGQRFRVTDRWTPGGHRRRHAFTAKEGCGRGGGWGRLCGCAKAVPPPTSTNLPNLPNLPFLVVPLG